MSIHVLSRGAVWSLAAFIASRRAALGLPNCQARARAELAAVAAVLAFVVPRARVEEAA